MSLEILYPGQRVGDLPISGVDSSDFVGGSPLFPSAVDGGLALCTAANAQKCVGLARHSREEGLENYEYKLTYVHAPSRVKVWSADGAAANCPYDSTRLYTAGDKLYIDNNGRLTNNSAAYGRSVSGATLTGQEPIGTVLGPTPAQNQPGQALIIQLERI